MTSKLLVPILALLVFASTACVSGYHTLEQGHYGVVITYGQNGGKPEIQTVQPGVGTWVNYWTQRWVDYPSAQQSLTMVRNIQEGQVKGDDSISCHDQNGVPFNLDVTITWRVDPQHVADLYILRPDQPLVATSADQQGQDIQTTVVRRIARSVIPVVCGDQTYVDIYTGAGKLKLQSDGLGQLQKEASKEYIEIDGFYPAEVYLQQAQQDAISRTANAQAAVQVAAQAQQQAVNEAAGAIAKAQGQATAEAVQANADANQKITAARADATAVALSAQAEAQANNTVSGSLNQNVLADEQLHKWNGQLPQYEGSGQGTTVQLPAAR